MLETVLKPVLFCLETYKNTRGAPMAGDDYLFRSCEP